MESLDDLVVSGKEIDQGLVRKILAPYLRLDKDKCTIRPTEKWWELSNVMKVLLYLVARKAMKALDFPFEHEEATVSNIINEAGVKKGSAGPVLRALLADRIIDQRSKGEGYLVPNHALERIKTMIEEYEKE